MREFKPNAIICPVSTILLMVNKRLDSKSLHSKSNYISIILEQLPLPKSEN
jgi:hypothetical protein